MENLYSEVCFQCNKLITNAYSTSFSLGIKMFAPELRPPIYAIYGFVRFADEIVDTFHDHDKKSLLDDFKRDTFKAIEHKLSLNPVLQSFQEVVNRYNIDHELIHAFLYSMEMDLYKNIYDKTELDKYIYGSAEVVGLMCLKVFLNGNEEKYNELKNYARALGAAFQKINFLRDINLIMLTGGESIFPILTLIIFQNSKSSVLKKTFRKISSWHTKE